MLNSLKTIKDLHNYCKINKIKGYSKLNKDSLIELINNHIKNQNKTVVTPEPINISLSEQIKNISINNKYNVLDLFCGCGGLTEGFKKVFNIICGIDSWDIAIESYKQNHNHMALCKDLTEFKPDDLNLIFNNNEQNQKQIDIIIGGPPCQAYSMGGKRDPNDKRANLFLYYYEFIKFFKPKIFVMENVVGILSIKDKNNNKLINTIMNILEENYTCKIHVLYAADFNVPQLRRRVIIIGVHKEFNINIPDIQLVSNNNRIPVSTILESREQIDQSYYLSERAINGINKKKERMKLEKKGFGAQFLDLTKPSYTIPARYWKDGYDALVKYSDTEIRRLTILELKRIQTFPDNYILCGNKKEQIMQIGNAVACNFAYYIAIYVSNILQLIDHPKISD